MSSHQRKRILVTGARGYIGAILARELVSHGHALRLVSRNPWPAGDPNLQGSVELVTAELTGDGVWEGLIDNADAVIHLSYRTDLRAAERDPEQDAAINIVPVQRLIEAISATGRHRMPVVFASTVTIFGPRPSGPVDEKFPDDPISVYDRHKLACETILRDATSRAIVSGCTLRLSNVYGYGPTSTNTGRGVLNAMMRAALHGEPMTLYGDGRYIRDYVHVRDVASAFRLAVETDATRTGEAYIVSGECGRSLKDVFSIISQQASVLTGKPAPVINVPEPADLHPIERRNFTGNSTLFRQRTGWTRKRPFEENIRNDLLRFQSDLVCHVGGGADK